MMHTPVEKALIEAVGVWREEARRYEQAVGPLATAICATYDAYMASLTTPPSVLPPAPEGKRWVRVEYRQYEDVCDGDWCLGSHCKDVHHSPYSADGRWFAYGLGHGWRLVDDPEADSLEKIAIEVECHGTCWADGVAKRIRALIGEGQ